jgi:hypothetical protein
MKFNLSNWHEVNRLKGEATKLTLKENNMRFMILMIPNVYRGNKKLDAKFAPRAEEVEKMGKFNNELSNAGALTACEGLHPLTTGARLSFAGGKATVTDGPFVEAKEVLGGYWMVNAKSKEEAVNWMKRCPAEDGDMIEIRQVFEAEDFK